MVVIPLKIVRFLFCKKLLEAKTPVVATVATVATQGVRQSTDKCHLRQQHYLSVTFQDNNVVDQMTHQVPQHLTCHVIHQVTYDPYDTTTMTVVRLVLGRLGSQIKNALLASSSLFCHWC